MPKQIELITREALGILCGVSKMTISHGVNRDRKLKDIKHDGQTGINLYDPMTIQYITEKCVKNNIPIPPQFQKEKTDVQIIIEGIDQAWEEITCEDCQAKKDDFMGLVVEFFEGEKG